jgi:hypothetical protein
MNHSLPKSLALLLSMVALGGATISRPSLRHETRSPGPTRLVDPTSAALLDQIGCQHRPQVARSINAMLRNRLIRYIDNESGVYYFTPTAPMRFLGLRITHISASDLEDSFRGTPGSRMVGTAPPTFLAIDVAASVGELRRRALGAGLVEAVPYEHRLGFDVSAGGSYSPDGNQRRISNIQCAVYP